MKPSAPFDPRQLGDLARRLHEDADGATLSGYRECFTTAMIAARAKLFEPLTAEESALQRALAEGSELCLEVLSAATSLLQPTAGVMRADRCEVEGKGTAQSSDHARDQRDACLEKTFGTIELPARR